MKLFRHLLFMIFFVCISLPVQAETGFEMDQLSSLFEQYKRNQAYQYASQYLAEQEGDPYFDYYYGVSAIDSGFASQGVFALERVLLVFPEDPVARLELARGYFILEEYARSRQEFEDVLQASPPDSVRQTADLYLKKIRRKEERYRTTLSGFVELGAGRDTNVNSAPDDASGFFLTPDFASLKLEDNFYRVAANFNVAHPFSPGWLVNFSATGDFKKNQEFDLFDTTTGTIVTGLAYRTRANRYSADIIAQEFQLDGSSYRSMLGLNLGWEYTSSELSSFSAGFQYARLEYDIFSILNSDLISLNFGYTHQFSVQFAPVFFSNFRLGTENAKSDSIAAQTNTERDLYSIRLGLALSLSPGFVLQSSFGLQNSKYGAGQFNITDGQIGINPVVRKDDFYSADISLLWLLNQDWRIDTRISYIENVSNILIREYDRTLFSLNLSYVY